MRPVLFKLPILGLPIFSYGVLLGLSCVLGAHLAVYLSERSGIERKRAWWMTIFVIVVGIVGGRLHELIVLGELFTPEALKLVHSGRTAYGAFISAIVGAILGARLFKLSFWRFGDAAAPTMALGLGLTRIGCFLYGCDYGFQSDTWGVCFPQGSPAFRDQIDEGKLTLAAPHSLPVFPAQLLSSLAGFAIFALLMWLWFRRPRRAGTVLLAFLFSYGLVRAGLEQLRDDMGRGTLLGMSTSTTIGLITAAGAGLALWLPPLAALRGDAGPVLDLPDEEDEEPEPKRKPTQKPGKKKQKQEEGGAP